MSSQINGNCEICQKLTTKKCGNCNESFYCNKEHQKLGWKMHKDLCRPFKIYEDDVMGRCLKSTRDIKSGEIILKEKPLIIGPSENTIPICLSCFKEIDEKTNFPCFDCGFPMCSEICQKNPNHLPECHFTIQRGDKVKIKNFGITHPIYQSITILRILYQKTYLNKIWSKLNNLQSHFDDLKNTKKFQNEKLEIVKFIKKFFKIDQEDDEILKICGIIMTNSHEVPLSDPPYVAIYEISSMLEHNCKANLSKSFTNDGKLMLISCENITKDENLSISYTDSLWGTENRLYHLNETKFFQCNCKRCKDVTEFSTYFSALKCHEKDCDGYLLPESFLRKTDNTINSNWKCGKCNKTTSCFLIQDYLDKFGNELSELPKNDEISLRNYIKSCQKHFHPNHFYLTEARLNLVQLIGQNGNFEDVPNENLESKIEIAEELIRLITHLAPAERRLKGVLLFEIHAAISEIGRKSCDATVMKEKLSNAKKYLVDCIELLKNEPSLLPEGQICNQAKENLKNIEIILKKLEKPAT